MKNVIGALLIFAACGLYAQYPGSDALSSLTQTHAYVQKRVSSYDRSGRNADAIHIGAGKTATIFDETGPGEITHLWFTIASSENYHLKKIVLRAYWNAETTPSVETPIGDFFGLGLGTYFNYQSALLSVAPDKALNSFFPMPFAHHARITISNEGSEDIDSFYYNIDYRFYSRPMPDGTLYFHAQYRQQIPTADWITPVRANDDPAVLAQKNLDGKDNYTWMEARGQGHFVGVTMSVLQNQDGWWGEGDDMFFVDGAPLPSLQGTGSEDYFQGAWDFGSSPFAYATFGAPQKGDEVIGSRSSVYRFHLDSPIPFTKSFRATIEHGHANQRMDNYYSVAYSSAAFSRSAVAARVSTSPRAESAREVMFQPVFSCAYQAWTQSTPDAVEGRNRDVSSSRKEPICTYHSRAWLRRQQF